MSANNWSFCPHCKELADKADAEAIKRAEELYGKVTAEHYEKLITTARKPRKREQSLREDWELGINKSGEFYVSYGGSCENCGMEFSYQDKLSIYGMRVDREFSAGPKIAAAKEIA